MDAEKEWKLFYWAGNLLLLGAIAYSYFILNNILWSFLPLAVDFVWMYCWCTLQIFQPVKNKQDRSA